MKLKMPRGLPSVLRGRSYYRRILLRVTVVVTLLLFAAEIALYVGISNLYSNAAAELQLEITRQYRANLESTLEQAASLVISQALLPEFRRFDRRFLDLRVDFDRFLQMTETLTAISGAFNPLYVHSVYFYHAASGMVFTGDGFADLPWFADRDYIRSGATGSVFRAADIGPLAIVDGTGGVAFSREVSVELLAAADLESETSTVRADGRRNFVSIVESEYTGWRYVSVLPVSRVIRTQRRIVNFFLILVVVFLIAALSLSLFLSRYTYKPILDVRNALEEVDCGESARGLAVEGDEVRQIEARIRRIRSENAAYRDRIALSQAVLTERARWGLVTGRADRADPSGLSEEERARRGPFRVWNVDHPQEIRGNREVTLHFHDRIARHFGARAHIVLLDFHRTLAVTDALGEGDLDREANLLYDALEAELPFRFCIAVGQAVPSMLDLGVSYHDSMRLQSYKRIASDRAILWEAERGGANAKSDAYEQVERNAAEFRRNLEYGLYEEALGAVDRLFEDTEGADEYSYRNSKINECANALISHTHLQMGLSESAGLPFSPWHGFQNLDSLDEIRTWFHESFARIQSHVQAAHSNAHGELMVDAQAFVVEHYDEPLTAQVMADRYGMSPNYFSTIFKREIGKSFSEFLHSLRMERAMRLLADTRLPLASVAHRAGFGDKQNIIRAFNKELGFSPTEYRKRCAGRGSR